MALELPALSAIIARLADPKINLAAYGGIVFPLALIVEAPIIMLLAASTALSKDWESYRKIRKFMHTTAGILTALHVIIVSTPLYFFYYQTYHWLTGRDHYSSSIWSGNHAPMDLVHRIQAL